MTKLYVKKFGGTSVGSFERIEAVADAIARAHHEGERQVLVLSAMAGETNRLYAMAANIDPVAPPRELDMLVTAGEQVSIALMAMALLRRGIKAQSLLGSQIKIRTNNQFGRANIEKVETENLLSLLNAGVVPVIAGFQGVEANGSITTLGRGGSDTTAVAIAAALNATECQIFTDVCGVFTTDPNIVPSARKLESISFEAMYEMARSGAKVLHPASVACAQRHGVVLRVLSSFAPGSGTLVEFGCKDSVISGLVGIAVSREQGLVFLSDAAIDSPSIVALFKAMGSASIDADVAAMQKVDGLSAFSLAQSEISKVLALIDKLSPEYSFGKIAYESELAKVSLIGTGRLVMDALASDVTELLAVEQIKIRLVSISENKLSFLLNEKDLHQAVKCLHSAFNLNKV